MKTLFAKLSVAAVLVSTLSAHAVYRPGWERPILRADLAELDEQGREENKFLDKSLTLNKRDGVRHPTSFTFTEEVQVQCITYPCNPVLDTKVFKITNIRKDGCQSTHYTAVAKKAVPVPDLGSPVLEVVDHSTRICKDLRRFGWDVKLKTRLGHRIFNREFGGNPKPVYTIQ